MFFRAIIIILSFITLNGELNAQARLNGKIVAATRDSVIVAVNIFNVSQRMSARSAIDGRYSIAAVEGDQIIFSIIGFRPDTVIVTYQMLLTQYDVVLHADVISLKEVKVMSSYQLDSVARRNYYSHMYEKLPGITGRNRPADGVGIVLSPVSFFARESRQKRELKKRLARQEQEDFIDHSFPLQWVENLTGLHGDSLRLFMYMYRPSYSFCRKTDREGMLIYVNDKLKEFKNPARKTKHK
jgi:hypothetical protein